MHKLYLVLIIIKVSPCRYIRTEGMRDPLADLLGATWLHEAFLGLSSAPRKLQCFNLYMQCWSKRRHWDSSNLFRLIFSDIRSLPIQKFIAHAVMVYLLSSRPWFDSRSPWNLLEYKRVFLEKKNLVYEVMHVFTFFISCTW